MKRLRLAALALCLVGLSGCSIKDVLSTISTDLPSIQQIVDDGTLVTKAGVVTTKSVHAPPDTTGLTMPARNGL